MSNNLIIAGEFGGRKVECVPALAGAFQKLLAASSSGIHSAVITMKAIKALETGRIGKSNIFVKSTGNVNTKIGNEEFYVFLPGLRATAEALPSGRYKIVDLRLDPSYFSLSDTGKVGIHRVLAAPDSDSWRTVYEEDGEIEAQVDRVVAVADCRYPRAVEAANAVATRISNAPGAKKGSRFRRDGFDLHFTPSKAELDGYRKFDAINNRDALGSSVLLAKTMLKAKNIEGVSWVADTGGSTVLTQAMKILVDQGVKLEKHSCYFYLPPSSPSAALTLAYQLSMTIDKEFVKTGFFQPRIGADVARSISARLSNDSDPYSRSDARKDVALGFIKTTTAAGVIGGLGGLVFGGAPAMAAIMGTLAGVSSLASLGSGTITWGHSFLEERKK